ncbi:MAG: emp24/gp25L/p24 family protein [Nitrososphaera sp.]
MARTTFYAMIAAGAAFIAIGIAASVYSEVAVDVPLDGKLAPGLTDDLSPDMDVGNTASIAIRGSMFDVEVKDPSGKLIVSQSNQTSFDYQLTADRAGEYHFMVENTGDKELAITGHAQTKASPLGLSAPLLLIVTGILVVGLSLRFRNR